MDGEVGILNRFVKASAPCFASSLSTFVFALVVNKAKARNGLHSCYIHAIKSTRILNDHVEI